MSAVSLVRRDRHRAVAPPVPVTPASPAEWSSGGEDDVVALALAAPPAPAAPAPPAAPPDVRVVRGRPDEVELAALVAGIVAARGLAHEAGGGPDEAAETGRGRWADHGRVIGAPPAPGADAWRWSLHP
ncbi:acyl-CoA carboxylase subunit epsilon [Georgenia thermotolerans]|nr:acyl-CoA carboxylase subunit epsilon [Georgenia thermotolerans]